MMVANEDGKSLKPRPILAATGREATARFESLDFGLPVLNQYI